VVVALCLAGAAPSAAKADYWDFQGTLSGGGDQYQESNLSLATGWAIRINRSNCNAKMQEYNSLSGWDQIEIPGGCTNSDHTDWFYTSTSFGPWHARARNTESTSVWANVRIATSM
jgi:hypothetical protein